MACNLNEEIVFKDGVDDGFLTVLKLEYMWDLKMESKIDLYLGYVWI